MKKIIIVSDDICIIKQTLNTINKIKINIPTIIYSTEDLKYRLYNRKLEKEKIMYIIDVYNMEDEFLEILRILRKYDFDSQIIVISMYNISHELISSRLMIYDHIVKWDNFESRLKTSLLNILKRNIYNDNININDSNISIIINKNDIDNIYNFPNNISSIQYKNGNNTILIPTNKIPKKIRKITNKTFYIDKSEIKTKRKHYSNSFKQLLVDLYLIYKIDCNIISNHFKVDIKSIKRWASLAKFNRKINIIEYIIGKILIKYYLKK